MPIDTLTGGNARKTWVVATVAYGALRVVLAGTFIADYGLNVYVFAIIELGSSLTLGLSTSWLVRDYVAYPRRVRPRIATIAIVSYALPDAYVFAFAGRMPARLGASVAAVVLFGLFATIVRIRRVRSSVT